jgi:hypothetical protein
LVDLRIKYDKVKYLAKERSDFLASLVSRVLDARAHATAVGQSASRIDQLSKQIQEVGDETSAGRQRSDYYKSILRHCEVNPARDPNVSYVVL